MTIAITAAYCRPFKQRPNEIKLSGDLVPTRHKETHDSLIVHRDKVIAHRDIDGPKAEWGFVSELLLVTKGTNLAIQTRSPSISNEIATQVLDLTTELIVLMDKEIDSFVHKFGSECFGKGDSIHTLNIEEDPESWLIKASE